ncbi:restriction endonuclease subunit S [Streptomyces griseoincarnatus]
MSEWDRTTVGDVITLQRGFDITKAQQNPGEVPVVSSGGIGSYHDTAMVRGPGVVMGRKGTLGKVFWLEDDYWPHDTTLWVKDFKGNNRRFVYYFLGTLNYLSMNVGSSNPTLNRNHVHPTPINWPPLEEQNGIAAVLGALDDKITVNGRITAVADELSGELFRHATLTSPERFTEMALSDTAEFINGRAFTKEATGTGRMVVRIAEINSGPGSSTVYNDIEVPEQHLARPGDVLFAWSGSLTVARWFRPEAIINQHIFKCVPKHGYPRWLVSQLVHRKIGDFRAIAADKATTMGHIQRKHLDEPVIVPESQELVSLDSQIAPLWERALLAERESLDLATLRDTLLPQLMSGRLRVKDAEKIVEDAT